MFRLCSWLIMSGVIIVSFLDTVAIADPPGGWVTPGSSYWRPAAPFSKSSPYIRPKNVIFHIHFQTWPVKSIPVVRPGARFSKVPVT